MKTSAYLILWLILLAASCDERGRASADRMPTQDELIEANKRKVNTETDLIDKFIGRSNWDMRGTDTGIRYEIYHQEEGKPAKTGDRAWVTYTLYLLDGTRITDTDVSGPLSFEVGQGDVASGLHEAVTLLSEGDSARIILPSYLAYGLTGDQDRIPPNAALFYDLSLVRLD